MQLKLHLVKQRLKCRIAKVSVIFHLSLTVRGLIPCIYNYFSFHCIKKKISVSSDLTAFAFQKHNKEIEVNFIL